MSQSSSYTFTNIVNRSLTANFASRLPQLSHFRPQPGTLALTWPTNLIGVELQQNSDTDTTNWVPVAAPLTVEDTNNRVNNSP